MNPLWSLFHSFSLVPLNNTGIRYRLGGLCLWGIKTAHWKKRNTDKTNTPRQDISDPPIWFFSQNTNKQKKRSPKLFMSCSFFENTWKKCVRLRMTDQYGKATEWCEGWQEEISPSCSACVCVCVGCVVLYRLVTSWAGSCGVSVGGASSLLAGPIKPSLLPRPRW